MGDAKRFLAVTVQLALLVAVVYLFRIEEAYGLRRLAPLILIGFVVHAWLPLRFRQPFFVVLTFVAIGGLFGPANGAWLVGIGLALIGLCHLPIPFAARVGLILASGGVLAALRAEWIRTDWSGLVLPVLGAMFMFRLIIYLYDLRHEKKPASVWTRLSYFFMLPNLCFPLFPVVDYQMFRRSFYDSDAWEIYQKGLLWMFRGMTHLLAYRAIYYHVAPSPSDVQDVGGVVLFVVSSYLLYLRVSGQFHLIVGILCLFGFNLPATNHFFFLASGFNDVWRRLNIYWKDFMVKIFYYPTVMGLRPWGPTASRAAATTVVFVATWLLHSYQWFWLRGTFPVTALDAIYWGILGSLVLVNSLYQVRKLKDRAAGEPGWSWRGALVLSLRTLGMFAFMSVLWSLWSSRTFSEWISVMSSAGRGRAGDYATIAAGIVVLLALGTFVQFLASRGWRFSWDAVRAPFSRVAVYTASAALLLVLAGLPRVQARLGEDAAAWIASLQESRFNQRDTEVMERGYYEGLLGSDRYLSQLWRVQMWRPVDWVPLELSAAVQRTDDLLRVELIPSKETLQKRVLLRTNRWGMKDREYDLEKPGGTFRIALLGASYTMGPGIEEGGNFESLVEDRLNREHAGRRYDAYEILNFAVGGYSVVQHIQVLDDKVYRFDPDLLLYTMHSGGMNRALHTLTMLHRNGIELPPFLADVLERAGATREMSEEEIRKRLRPYGDEVLSWGYRRIVDQCNERGITPVWLYIPRTEGLTGVREQERPDHLRALAREAGFMTHDIGDAFAGHDKSRLQLRPWDAHPNELGHRLLADRLYALLLENEAPFGLGLSGGGPESESPE